jgi:serine/threonine protein kinase
MNPDDWPRVKEIFQGALDLPPGDRKAYVRSAAGGDDDLRREVESLLESADSSEDFLSQVAADYVPSDLFDEEAPDANIGRRIGPYRIEREIGSGGMGAVYLAERVDEFQQKVAVKLMRRGMDSRTVVSRFRYERQILAGLDHPNIARLLDGGATEDGRPYFVMEYVEGVPIDAYCARHELPVRRRVELFRQVCAAVQYAHQSLVVHRDIKPGNILVGEDGVPKLLDFGIAKLLREQGPRETALTQLGVRPMTPEYASPEQVRGLRITTASDIYSLGVVLYELLASKPPYALETCSALELDRVICEADPPRPSLAAPEAVAKSLRGDLDVIVLKAMEKDPARRYASAEQLSEDLRRHLEGIPVMARPLTLMYRTSRFVRRNRTAVAAAVLVIASLTGGMVTTTWQARRADRRFNDVRRLAHSFLFEFDEKIRDLAGSTPARQLIVARALEYLRSLSQEAGGDVSLKRELAEAYLKVGDVQGNPYLPNLGDTAGAANSYRQALALAQSVARQEPGDLVAAVYVARAHRSLGEVLPLLGDVTGALSHLKQSVAALESAPARDADATIELSRCYEMLGDVLGHSGLAGLDDAKGSRAAYDKALALTEPLATGNPDSARFRRNAAVLRMKIADMQVGGDETERGIRNYQAVAEVFEQLSRAEPDNASHRRMSAAAHRKLGVARETLGDTQSAMREYQVSGAILDALIKADPANRQSDMDYAVTQKNIGDLEYKTGNKPVSLAAYVKALGRLKALSEAEPDNYLTRGRYAMMLIYAGEVQAELKQTQEADRNLRAGLAVAKLLADRPGATPADVAGYAEYLMECPIDELQDPEQALRYARKAADMTNNSVPEYLEHLARAYYSADRPAEAVAVQQKVVALRPGGPERRVSEKRLALFQRALQKK